MNKCVSAADAVSVIESGMTIGIGGWGPRRKPMALVRELLRSDVRDLTVVAYGGADVGLLCGAGKVRKVVYAFVSLDFMPLEPGFRKARETGSVDVREIDEGMMLLGLRAAAWGSPYIPTRIGLGTDVITRNPDLQLVDSPYDDKEWVAMPALNLDVSLLHATRGDARGVCEIASPDHYMDDWFARAANKTVVSVDELVPSDYFHNADVARRVYWERNLTSHIVHIPGGAHPSSSDPLYGYDMKHYKEYAAALAEGGYDGWSEAYLGDSESSYQRNVGGLEVIQTLPLPVY
ncbi:acyl CoA--acetate/3-ketoacid CoA transferase subunit alpha [Luminiphilus sp.]|nr:acyl CoA--acetate/3-ketoacid CoA transferase subunit alpha [Luminiphilus sp.]